MSDNSVNTDIEELSRKFVINVINAIKSNKCDILYDWPTSKAKYFKNLK